MIVLLGAPLGCCDAPRLEAQPTMLRLIGVAEGKMTLDGRFESKQSP